MVNQVVLEWPRALAPVEEAHTRWQDQSRVPLVLLGLTVKRMV